VRKNLDATYEEYRGNNPIPDLLGFQHIKHLFKNKLNDKLLAHYTRIKTDSKRIQPLLKIDVPKGNYTIRPMSRPILEEWLIYEALISSFATIILTRQPEICARSYSILRFKGKTHESASPWLQFEQKCQLLFHEGFNHVVTTDITGYYEHISLNELRKRFLNSLEQNNKDFAEDADLLFSMLRRWSQDRILDYSLPQGPSCSSFLGDLYLDYVDRKMEKYPGYYRYMDDIRIFCKSKLEIKIALKELIVALRELKLNINAKKTNILANDEISNNLFDKHHQLMSIIEEVLKSRNHASIQDKVTPALINLFESSFDDDPFEKRHLTFALYRLSILYNSEILFDHDRVIQTILSSFEDKPHHTAIFCDFLCNFNERADIFVRLFNFIQSADNIYEWQELKIIQCLLHFKMNLGQKEKDFIIAQIQNKNKHSAVRCFYFALLGKYSTNRERDLIIAYYNELDNDFQKMAIVLAVQELSMPSKASFYSRVKQNDSEQVAEFVDYIKGLKYPLYSLSPNKKRIETYKEFEPSMYA
jgi:hypothetical protein